MTPEATIGVTDTLQWTVVGLKDEQSGRLSYLFRFPVGDGTVGTLELSNDLSLSQMAQRLRAHTVLLPKAGATQFIEDLVLRAAAKFVINARQPGWKETRVGQADLQHLRFAAFVTPGQIVGPACAEYRWTVPLERRHHVGQTLGSLADWSSSVASLADKSNYIAFTVMLALAGPLLAFADLPEDPAFNMFGETSVGKTTSAKVGASVLGHPDALSSWDISERGLEEAAAVHCDLMLVLNAAERASLKRRREVLNRIIHMVAERASTVRSHAVQEQLPNLTWRTILLSTSNKPGAQMAAEARLSWDLQEAVRFIDIPIPSAIEGGIFDRLGAVQDVAGQSTKLIHELECALQQNYGVLLRPWIEYLLTTSPRERVFKLIARFNRKTGPHKGLDDRVARKFGLVYAAGKMAVEAGLLKWPGSLPLSATKTLLDRARHRRTREDATLDAAVLKLLDAIADPRLVPSAARGGTVKASKGKTLLGVRYSSKGQPLVGLRKEGLSEIVGADMTDAVQKHLARYGAIMKGHGGKSTQQLPITLEVGGTVQTKPRFLVIDLNRLPG